MRQRCMQISAVCKLEERHGNRQLMFHTWQALRFGNFFIFRI